MAMPLALVVMASMIKDAYEDYKRHVSDRSENEKESYVYNPDSKVFELKKWKDIGVGEIVKIQSEEFIPADILLLHTSDPKNIGYVETKGLDGETNLKIKSV
jgi:phospholipid-transporting ATPase